MNEWTIRVAWLNSFKPVDQSISWAPICIWQRLSVLYTFLYTFWSEDVDPKFFCLAPILCAENCGNNPLFEKWLSPILTCPVSRESQRRRNPVEHQQEADVDNCLQRFPHLPIVFTLHVLVWLGVILVMNNLSILFLSLRQRIGAIKFNEGDSGSICWTIKLGVKFPPHFSPLSFFLQTILFFYMKGLV